MVEATLNYLAAMPERPVYYQFKPPEGTPWRNTRGDRRLVPIHDAREDADPHLDREGYALVRQPPTLSNWTNADEVRSQYYPEIEELVRLHTGATRVLAFDHNVRHGAETNDPMLQTPVRYVHNDYTVKSGPQRVRELMGDESERLLRHRVAVINVWRPVRGPVLAAPLAFCDAQSIAEEDWVPTDLLYQDRSGEVYSMTYNPAHRWLYFPVMEASEVLLLKCYDSAAEGARFTAHTAFDDPTSAASAPPRESIEVRTLAFFAPED